MGRIDETQVVAQKRLRGFLSYLKDNPARTVWAALFLAIAAWGSLMNHFDRIISVREPWYYLSSLIRNIGPELAGIVIGVMVIDYLNGQRQEQQFKAQLILQMASKHNEVTDTAVRTLRAYGWLTDGSLNRADLYTANLHEARLYGARLEEADLRNTDLGGAGLQNANLVGARLNGAILKDALLFWADLRGADLSGANLDGLNLFSYSVLPVQGWTHEHTIEQLAQAKTLNRATMPDGVRISEAYQPTFEEWVLNWRKKQSAFNGES